MIPCRHYYRKIKSLHVSSSFEPRARVRLNPSTYARAAPESVYSVYMCIASVFQSGKRVVKKLKGWPSVVGNLV